MSFGMPLSIPGTDMGSIPLKLLIRLVDKQDSQSFSSSLSLKYALKEGGCRIGYEPTKSELRSLSAVDIQGHQRGGFCTTMLIRSEDKKVTK